MPERMFMRNSERISLGHCRQQYAWSTLEGWTPRSKRMDALLFGDLIHRSLAAFYIPEQRRGRKPKRGPHPAETFNKLCDALVGAGRDGETLLRIEEDGEDWVSARELGTSMMEMYIEEYGLDERYFIIYPEMPFQYRIKDPKTGQYLVTWTGTSDALIRDLEWNTLGLFEHKTAKTIDTRHLFIDDQAGSYWAIVPRWLKKEGILDEPLKFMLYNFMRKGKRDERPVNEEGARLNQDGTVSKRQPVPYFKRVSVKRGPVDRRHAIERIVEQARDKRKLMSGELAIYKTPSKDCGFCQFRDICELHEMGADYQEVLKLNFRKHDPYEAHVWALDAP